MEAEVRKLAGAIFSIDIASAQQKDVPVIRMETKVVSKGQKLLPTKFNERFSQKLDEWLQEG